MQQLASFCMDLLETSGAIWDTKRSKLADNIIGSYMGAPGLRIAGGTDEIMTNIIAERVLGLAARAAYGQGHSLHRGAYRLMPGYFEEKCVKGRFGALFCV